MSRIAMALLMSALVLLSGPTEAARLRRGAGRQMMSFVPGDRSRPAQTGRPHRAAIAKAKRPTRSRTARGRDSGGDEGGAATATPGPGFKMMDGVLTYPAPARFQPKVLKRQ